MKAFLASILTAALAIGIGAAFVIAPPAETDPDEAHNLALEASEIANNTLER